MLMPASTPCMKAVESMRRRVGNGGALFAPELPLFVARALADKISPAYVSLVSTSANVESSTVHMAQTVEERNAEEDSGSD